MWYLPLRSTNHSEIANLQKGNILYRIIVTLTIAFFYSNAEAARCLFISSYHQGYEWADGIEEGVKKVLLTHCDFKQINMDTKRFKEEDQKIQKGKEAKAFIEQWKPDVVIVADDNASKYLVSPYFINSDIPFVFCGLNWTVAEYGYPASNITGMIEVSPIQEMFEKIQMIVPKASLGYYIGVDTLTEQKSFDQFNKIAKRFNLTLRKRLAINQSEWIKNYKEAQKSDFLILGTKSGINDWDDEIAHQIVSEYGRIFSITDYEWMTRFSVLGLTKIAQEQGEWAAKTALNILQGASPSSIPIIPNQHWDIIINDKLLKNININIPDYILLNSKKVNVR